MAVCREVPGRRRRVGDRHSHDRRAGRAERRKDAGGGGTQEVARLPAGRERRRGVSARYEAKIAQIEQGQSGRAATAALHETFEEYARSYVCDRRLGRSTGRPLEASSRRGYLTILDNQLLPYLPQGVRIDEVSTDMVEGLL